MSAGIPILDTYLAYQQLLKEVHQYEDEARAYSIQYGLTGEQNGEGDAMRHAYVSAELTKHYGEHAAHVLGNLVEYRMTLTKNEPISERNMDKWNNRIGR